MDSYREWHFDLDHIFFWAIAWCINLCELVFKEFDFLGVYHNMENVLGGGVSSELSYLLIGADRFCKANIN
jgi:hypothetical protein